MIFRLDDTSTPFEIYRRKAGGFAVRMACGDEGAWDYDDEDFAREMTADVRGCKNFDECMMALGLGGY